MLTREQQSGIDAWSVYGENIHNYEDTFHELFPDQPAPLLHFVDERRRLDKPIVVLDIMSDPTALRWLRPDQALAVGLTDQRRETDKQHDDEIGIDMLAGDIINQRIWKKVVEWAQQHSRADGKFNLIIERGLGGLNKFPTDQKFYEILLQHLWSVLSNDHGLMVLQAPPEVEHLIKPWVEQCVAAGIPAACAFEHTEYVFPTLKLEKFPDSPDQLPELTSQSL